jgi:hypothetical protein
MHKRYGFLWIAAVVKNAFNSFFTSSLLFIFHVFYLFLSLSAPLIIYLFYLWHLDWY